MFDCVISHEQPSIRRHALVAEPLCCLFSNARDLQRPKLLATVSDLHCYELPDLALCFARNIRVVSIRFRAQNYSFVFFLTWPSFHWILHLHRFSFFFSKLRSATDRRLYSNQAFPCRQLPLFVRLAHFAEHSVRLRRMTSGVWAQLLAASI